MEPWLRPCPRCPRGAAPSTSGPWKSRVGFPNAARPPSAGTTERRADPPWGVTGRLGLQNRDGASPLLSPAGGARRGRGRSRSAGRWSGGGGGTGRQGALLPRRCPALGPLASPAVPLEQPETSWRHFEADRGTGASCGRGGG